MTSRKVWSLGATVSLAIAAPVTLWCCNTPLPQASSSCQYGVAAPTLTLRAIGGSAILLIASNATTAVSAGGATSQTATTMVSSPTAAAVALELEAQFTCPIEGTVHGMLTTSVGQFSSGIAAAASSSGGGGGMSEAGTSAAAGTAGVSGTSVTLLLTSDDTAEAGMAPGEAGEPSDASTLDATVQSGSDSSVALSSVVAVPSMPTPDTLFGYTTLQATTDRVAIVQAVVGDTSLCAQLVIDGPLEPPPIPNTTVAAHLVPCTTPVDAQFDLQAEASAAPATDGAPNIDDAGDASNDVEASDAEAANGVTDAGSD